MVDPEIQKMLDEPIRSGARASGINVHRIPLEQRVLYRDLSGDERKAYRARLAEDKARQIDLEDAVEQAGGRRGG